MGKAIGIDLGTTNTAVAVLVDGRPRVLEDDKGYKVLPSCISMRPDGETVVGQAARNLALTQPDRTVQAVKRLVGRRFDSPEVDRIRRRAAYGITPADDGGCLVSMAGESWTPTQISALVLQHARQIAERALGEEVDEAVITVPAYFNHAQRAATFEAARIAGLRCERLLNEPTAAALAYGYRKDVNRTIVIYDLGGGTFDVSVLQLSKGVYEVLSTAGETFLGGEDFDHRLVDHLAEQFQGEHGVDLRTDRESLQRLKEASERAKCELSFTDQTTVLVPRITATDNLEVAVTRHTLEGLVEDFVDQSVQITRRAVSDAGLRIQDIDDVILVGGQTRMPRVREAIGALFGKEPSRSVHPEEVVAIGAAVHAHSLVDPSASKPLLLDVTPFDLGIDVAGGLFQPIITRNSHVPASSSRTFATAHDNQDNVQVTVRQGESRFATENEFLGRFVMTGLTPAPRMTTKVEVTFRLDSNGMLHVAATEPATGERKRITIRNYAEVAQGSGEVEPSVEGDVAQAGVAAATGGALGSQQTAAPTGGARGAAGSQDKKGLLSRLFGKKDAPAAAPQAEPATPEQAGDDPYAADEPWSGSPEGAAAGPGEPTSPLAYSGAGPAPVDDAPEALSLGAEALQPLGDGPDAGVDDPPPLVGSLQMLPEDDDAPLELGDAGLVALDDDGLEPLGDDAFDELGDAGDPFSQADPFESLSEASLSATEGPAPDADADPFADPFAEDNPTQPDAPDPFAGDDDFEDPFGLGASEELDDPFSEAAIEQDTPALVADADLAEGPLSDPPLSEGDTDDGGFGFEDLDDPFTQDDEPTMQARAEAPAPAPVEEDDSFALPLADDDELARALAEAASEQTAPMPKPQPKPKKRRKPARLKLAYPRADAMVAEYRENLRRGGCFIRTDKPLKLGRECLIEVRAPGLSEPIRIDGVVTWSSAGQVSLAPGQSPGMGIEYRLDAGSREAVEETLSALA